MTTEVFNIAYGTMALLFGYILWMLLGSHTSFLLSIVVVIGLSSLFSLFFLPIFTNLPEPVEPNSIIITFAILLITESALTYLFSSDWRIITLDPVWDTPIIKNILVSRLNIFISLFSLLFILFVYFAVQKTRAGLLFRACIDNKAAARRFGIRVNLIGSIAFLFGGVFMAIAGSVYAVTNYLYPASGIKLTMIALTVTIFAGKRNIPGLLIGGIFLGLAESFTGYFIGGNWQTMVISIFMILFLIAKKLPV